MEQALVDWDAKDDVDKTWKNAKAYFTKEYRNRNKHAAIKAKQAGYGSSANQARETPSKYPFNTAPADYAAAKQALAAKITQQVRRSDSSDLKKVMDQQQSMLESNQKLMMQLMQQMIAGNRNGRPRGNTSNPGIAGGASKPRYKDWQMEKKGDSIQMNGKT